MNFRITVHQNSDNLHRRLDGNFDGSSAYQLLNTIEKRCRLAFKAFIHTNGLWQIDPFGSSVFKSHLGGLMRCKHMLLRFTGEHADALTPERL